MTGMEPIEEYLRNHDQARVAELTDLLAFQSLSGDPACRGDVEAAAHWVAERMRSAGIKNVQLLPPAGHPVVYGHWLGAPGAPTVLIYGHYDVQPPDPLDLWQTPPFDPTIRDGRIYARGASDMKANLLLPITALESILACGGAPSVNLKFLFEGQEEIGSPDLARSIAGHLDLFRADMAVSADGGNLDEDRAAIWLGTRGLAPLQIEVTGPSRDVHSGLYGGAIANPLNALSRIVASLHDSSGRIAVAGFYDDVDEAGADERAKNAAVPITDDHVKRMTGVAEVVGEAGYTTYERTTMRPSLDVNGFWGGYMGEGTKTVIPSRAHAKITCRLVASQDPSKVVALIEDHIRRHAPVGVTVTVAAEGVGARPYSIPLDHPGNRLAADILRGLFPTEPIPMRIGGTVPVYDMLKQQLGIDTVTFGFGQEDERIHSPNEFFRLSNFRRGQLAYVRLLLSLRNAFGSASENSNDPALVERLK